MTVQVIASSVLVRGSWSRRRSALAASLAAATMALGATGASAQTPALSWQACPEASAEPGPPPSGEPGPTAECAQVTVPLDYAAPGGRTIDVAVSRIRAADPQQRRGVLLLNPGGPGGPGLDLPELFAQLLPADVLARYDLIGFDPRGVGRSAPVTCALGAEQLDPGVSLPWPAPAGFDANVAFARGVAQACGSGPSADVLPFITTANTARDMDRIRSALGEEKISYLGYSYGTYLGAVYASLFADRSDRFVLDSVASPHRVWRDTFRAWGPATEVRFPDFARFAAANDDRYGLGATPEAVRALYFELGARLDRAPLTLPDGYVMSANSFRETTRSSLYNDVLFEDLAQLWQFVKGAGVAGTDAGMAAALRATLPEVPTDNFAASLYSVICDDVQWPEDPEVYRRDVARDGRLFPLAGGMAANIFPCAFWPSEPREPLVGISDDGPVNILVVQGLRDPATPLAGAQELRRDLRRRSRLTTANVGGHGIAYLSENTCAADTATTYLISGRLPADRRCPAEPLAPGARRDTATAGRGRVVAEIVRRMRMLAP